MDARIGRDARALESPIWRRLTGRLRILGAVFVGQDIAGWIVGLTSVVLSALLWSSRQL